MRSADQRRDHGRRDLAAHHASRFSIASRTSSAAVRTPSLWRITEDVLAMVLYETWINHAISERLLPVPSKRKISISRDVSFASGLRANDGPANAMFRAIDGGRYTPPSLTSRMASTRSRGSPDLET